MKKYLPIIVAALFAISAFTGCASRTSNEAAPLNISEAYAKLIAYKTEDYSQQSVADFHAQLASTPEELEELLSAQADVISHISADDENYDFFITTMNISTSELYCEHMGEAFGFFVGISKESRPCKELDEYGEVTYQFFCSADLQVGYTIDAPELLTVAERDDTLRTFEEEMSKYLNSLSEDEIMNGNIRMKLIEKANALANSLSNEKIKLSSVEIVCMDLLGGD